MTFVTVFRATVPEENVKALLEIRSEAIAEAQRLCPELLAAELVRLDDGEWLDILTWSVADGAQRMMEQAAHFEVLSVMHGLVEASGPPESGEIVNSARP